MEITINNQNYQLRETCSVEQLLSDMQVPNTRGIAIAVNQQIIPKSDWNTHTIQHGDQLTLIKATQGG